MCDLLIWDEDIKAKIENEDENIMNSEVESMEAMDYLKELYESKKKSKNVKNKLNKRI